MLFQSVFPASISSFSCIHFSVFMSLFFCFFCRFFSVFRFECSVLPVFIPYFPRIFIFVLSAFYSCTSCILLLFFLHSSFGFPFSPLVLFAFYSCTSCILLLFFLHFLSLSSRVLLFISQHSFLYFPSHSSPFYHILLGRSQKCFGWTDGKLRKFRCKTSDFFVRMFRGFDVKVLMSFCEVVSMLRRMFCVCHGGGQRRCFEIGEKVVCTPQSLCPVVWRMTCPFCASSFSYVCIRARSLFNIMIRFSYIMVWYP